MSGRIEPGLSVVVTGGAGFLGVNVVRKLLERGCTLTVLDDLSTGSSLPDDLAGDSRCKLVVMDVRDAAATNEAIVEANPGAVVHLAALHFIPACVKDPSRTVAINVLGTQHVLDACACLDDPPTFLFASTADVYAPSGTPHDERSEVLPDNVYGLSKLTAESLVQIAARQGSCSPLICRFFNLYGPGETNPHVIPEIIDQLKRGDEIHLGNTAPRRDFVFVEDAASAVVGLLDTAPIGTKVNVGTGTAYSVDDVVLALRGLTDRDLRVVVDEARWRRSDRPVLESNPRLLRTLLANPLPTVLRDGLRRTLIAEGVATRSVDAG